MTIKYEDLPPEAQSYVRLHAAEDPIEAFNVFIERWVPLAMRAHLMDNDDNDAEWVRGMIRRAIERT